MGLLPLAAQTTGSLEGVVTDARTHAPVASAIVRVEGTGRETTSDSTGAYRIAALPAGNYTVNISYIGLTPASTEVAVANGQVAMGNVALAGGVVTLEAVKVESVREGQARAINEQRASNTITNIIASDAIGNLPDNTLGDALARIAGVNVIQSEGEPSYVTIRGAAPQFNSIRVDGQVLPAITDPLAQDASSDNRSINVSLIPSEIISSVEVVKALTPDTDADSIGGQVNIRTRSGFDLAEPVVSGSFDSYYNDFRARPGYGASLSYVGPVNAARTLGLGFDFNYRNLSTDEEDSETVFYPKTDPAVSGIAGIAGGDAISEYDTRFREQRKITLGGSANLDWKLGDRTVLKFRTFFNRSERFTQKWRTRSTGLTSFAANSTDTIASGTSSRLRKIAYDQEYTSDIYQLGFSGETKLPQGGIAYSASFNDTPVHSRLNRYDSDTPSATRKLYSWTVNRTNPLDPTVRIFNTATGANGYAAGDETLTDIWRQTGNDAERNYTGAVDYTRTDRLGDTPVTFKFGAKFADKDRQQRPVVAIWTPSVAPAMKTLPLAQHQPGGDLFFGTVPTMGAFASLPAVLDLLNTNPANYPFASTNAVLGTVSARIYDVTERIGSTYGMATAHFGRLEAIAGLRLEETHDHYNWIGGTPPVQGTNTYDNFLPDLLFNYRFNRNQILRASWTHSLARPDYNELVPYSMINDPDPSIDATPANLTQVYRGNPNLHAARSSNYDVSYEWYFQPAGLASIGVFHKDITGFLFRSTTIQTVAGAQTAIHQFQNGAKAQETGVELSWSQALSALPGPLGGLGFSANSTMIVGRSSSYLLDPVANQQLLVTDKFIPGQPKAIQNFQLYWEKYGFTARVAFNYVSANIDAVDGHVPNTTVAPARTVDATVKYRLTKNLVVYLQGKNLRRQVEHWYDYGNANLNEETDYLGRSFSGGVKYHF